jgi:hypothetical protein
MPAQAAGILFCIDAHVTEPLTMPGVGPILRQQMRDTKDAVARIACLR